MSVKMHRLLNPSWLIVFLLLLCTPLSAQFISIKSLPLATGSQFLTHPSQRMGMGGVSLTLSDQYRDPFVNPAKGILTQKTTVFTSPAYYNITQGFGHAQTVPLGVLMHGRQWFAGGSMAVQQLSAPHYQPQPPTWLLDEATRFSRDGSLTQYINNFYGSGYAGTMIPGTNIAVAAGFSGASLNGMEGIDLLYRQAQDIDQYGYVLDGRLGAYHQWEDGRSFELVGLLHNFKMTHNVTNIANQTRPQIQPEEMVKNLDFSLTTGLHFGYVHPFRDGKKVGFIATGNWKSHPKIPNYELMNIPRDPGTSSAYNFGIGFSHDADTSVFALEVIFEPIWSTTWAEAQEILTTESGQRIHPGDRTVVNDFIFDNYIGRIGIEESTWFGKLQVGVNAHWIRYSLTQENYIDETVRTQDESWVEWAPTWSLRIPLEHLDIIYNGQLQFGTGQPGVGPLVWFDGNSNTISAPSNDFVIAPSSSLTLRRAKVMTHQLTLAFPL